MFISVQVSAPVMLVRRRTGEHVGNPIQEHHDGGEVRNSVTTEFDLRHRTVEPPTDLESFEIPTELEGVSSDELLVAEAAASSSQSDTDQSDNPEHHNDIRRRAELDRPIELRRLLSQMHELSMLARPAKHTFVRHLEHGLAKATLRVWRGELTLYATVESFRGGASHTTRARAARGGGARLRGEGRLEPDGSIRGLRLDVALDDLPALGPIEQAQLDRLKREFIELFDDGADLTAPDGWLDAHSASTRRRPEVPLLLLVALLTDLERTATGLLDGSAPTVSQLTLHDLIERRATETPPDTGPDDETLLVWLDDHTPVLDVPGVTEAQLHAVNAAFRRVLGYLPAAWSTRPT